MFDAGSCSEISERVEKDWILMESSKTFQSFIFIGSKVNLVFFWRVAQIGYG